MNEHRETVCNTLLDLIHKRKVPFISPLRLTMTPALSSKLMKMPSFRRKAFRCLTTTPWSTAGANTRISEHGSASHSYMYDARFNVTLCDPMKPFFLSSGFPFLTVQMIMSPTLAAGRRFRRPLMPHTDMMYKFLAPELSAQLSTAPTGKPSVMRYLLPAAPARPLRTVEIDGYQTCVQRDGYTCAYACVC